MERLNFMDWLTTVLALLGGVQLGLVGFFNYNLLNAIFTSNGWYRAVLAVISLAVLYLVADVWVRVTGYESSHAHA